MLKSIHDVPPPAPAKEGSALIAFLFLAVLALGFLGAGLVLGIEPRLVLERREGGTFQVTASNHFAGYSFYSRSIDGVKSVLVDNAVRDERRDPEKVNRKRRRDLHLDLIGTHGARLGWDKESDVRVIEDFMRGTEPSLSLADAPPLWRLGAAWFLVGLGGLTFLGAIQSFFPKKNQSPITPVVNRKP